MSLSQKDNANTKVILFQNPVTKEMVALATNGCFIPLQKALYIILPVNYLGTVIFTLHLQRAVVYWLNMKNRIATERLWLLNVMLCADARRLDSVLKNKLTVNVNIGPRFQRRLLQW